MSARVRVGVLTRLVLWPIAHPWRMLSIAGLCAALAALAVTRLRPSGSLAAMFPAHDPAADALVRVLDDFPAADELIVLASLPDGTTGPDADRLVAFGHRFAESVQASPEMQRLTDGVFYRPDADTRAFVEKVIGPSAIFYLDEPTFDAARKRLTYDEMRRQLEQDKAILAAPGPGAALAALARTDPLRLHEFLTGRLAAERPFRTYQNGDAFVSPDGRSLLIRVIGRQSPDNLDYSKALTAGITRLAERVNTDGLRLEYTGSYPIAARSEQAIRRDMIGSTIGSVLLLQALFLLAYRSPFKLFALAFGPVALGILLGFGVVAMVSHDLTPLTAVLGAILAGMGIDYSVQYLSYYESRRISGSDARRAAEETAAEMSPAVLAAWATSAIGFVAIGCSTVEALRQFALLGTLGLTGAFLCAVIVLPAILMLTDRRPTPTMRSRLRFQVDRSLTILGHWRRAALTLCALLAIGSVLAIAAGHGDVLPLESDLTVMHPRPNPAIDAEYHVAKAFGISPDSLMVYLHADDSRRLVELACEVERRLKTTAEVTGSVGLANLLPDPATVSGRIDEVAAIDPERVVADFRRARDDAGFAHEAFEGYANFLHLLLTQRQAPGVSDLLRYRRLAETLLPASAFQNGLPHEAITLVFVSQPLDQDRASRDQAIAAVRGALSGIDGVTVTGLGVIAHDAEQTIHSQLPRLILVAVLIVAIYLAVHFRNLVDALLSLLPGIFGMLVAAAVLRLAGQKLNMINLVAVPLLIGIDVDYGIFLVTLSRFRRVREQNADELIRRLSPATHAVIVCAAATLLGYISLIWTSVPAERSLGIAAAVGIGACLAGVLLLLVPIFFSLIRKTEGSSSP
jgi:predicted RND superfamily exporter protein